jgi:putative N6-adenine-specific DNA methylase
MHNYLLTSALWLEALVKKEVQKQWYKIREVQDKAIYFSGEIEAIARMNIWSRFGNILYYIVDEQERVRDFDAYFDVVAEQNWMKYIPEWYEVVVNATAIKSELWAISTLQWVAKKAIVKSLVWDGKLRENKEKGKIEIQILMNNDTLKIMINTSGEGLHRRGYREMTGQAPLKENIAAAMVILSGWKFRDPLHDLFCGSGTIAIEALMIAKNIAPWLKRRFAFQDSWNWIPRWLLDEEKKRAESMQFDWEYKIYSSDIRKEVVESAKRSAKFAGFKDGEIEFSCQGYEEALRKWATWYIVSNPPYWLRLDEDGAQEIHDWLAKAFAKDDILWGIITSDLEFEKRSQINFKKRKLYNWGEMCYFYRKL